MLRARFFAFAASAALALLWGDAIAAPKDKGAKKAKPKPKVEDVEEPLPEGVTRPTESANYDEIADGSRHLIRDGEISIIPPKGWELFKKNVTFLAQAPLKPTTKYQRNLQITRMTGARYLDEFAGGGARELIEDRFAKASKLISGYVIQSDELIALADGRPAMLLKATFKLGDVPLAHAHVIVSDEQRHFIITFTDTAANFGGEGKVGKNLLEALTTIKTVEMKGKHPVRLANVFAVTVGGGVIVVLGLIFLIFRFFRASRRFAEMGEGKNLDLNEREERHDLIEANRQERVRVEVHMEESTTIARTGLPIEGEAVDEFEPEAPPEDYKPGKVL